MNPKYKEQAIPLISVDPNTGSKFSFIQNIF